MGNCLIKSELSTASKRMACLRVAQRRGADGCEMKFTARGAPATGVGTLRKECPIVVVRLSEINVKVRGHARPSISCVSMVIGVHKNTAVTHMRGKRHENFSKVSCLVFFFQFFYFLTEIQKFRRISYPPEQVNLGFTRGEEYLNTDLNKFVCLEAVATRFCAPSTRHRCDTLSAAGTFIDIDFSKQDSNGFDRRITSIYVTLLSTQLSNSSRESCTRLYDDVADTDTPLLRARAFEDVSRFFLTTNLYKRKLPKMARVTATRIPMIAPTVTLWLCGQSKTWSFVRKTRRSATLDGAAHLENQSDLM